MQRKYDIKIADNMSIAEVQYFASEWFATLVKLHRDGHCYLIIPKEGYNAAKSN